MITLTVAEAVQMGVGRTIARLASDVLESMKLESGDTVEIKGKATTVATVWRARPADDNLNIIRIDGIIRHNAKTSIGEQVEVAPVKSEKAVSITIAPVAKVQFGGDPTNYFREKLVDRSFVKGMKFVVDIVGTSLQYVVTNVQPKGVVKVDANTQIHISESEFKEGEQIPDISYEDIGGLKSEIEQIREMIELPIRHPEVFERLGIGAPKGVLLTGPPGTGKTLLAKAVASETEANFYNIAGPEIVSKFYGESEKQLRNIFEQANKNAPSIIFIDEVDSIAPNREESQGEVERRIVSTLLTMMDGLKSRGQVVVIAATNRADAIDPALRRPGRFDREIMVGVPDEEGRHEILQIHTRGMPLEPDVNLRDLAEKTLGFTGADLEALCKEAAMKSIKKYLPSLKAFSEKVPTNVLEKIRIRKEHFDATLQHLEPSAMREVLIQRPKTKWNDIGGLEKVKEQLMEAVIWPISHPEYFKQAGIRPPKGILLHGPPGTGKTLLAKALANEAQANFISVKGPELISKWAGESLPYDEKVMVIEDRLVDFKQIGEIVDNNINNLMAPTIRDDFIAKNSKVTDLIKHPAPPYIDIIKTKTGREIKVTGGHSLFVKENGKFKDITADEIEPNKTFVAIPSRIIPAETINSINMLDYLSKKDYGLYVKNGQEVIKKAIVTLGAKRAAEIMQIEEKSIHAYSKIAALGVKKFIELANEANIEFDRDSIILKGSRQSKQMPARINFDRDLCTFLGLWTADGCYNREFSVRLSASVRESEFAINLCKRLFGHVTVWKKGNAADITIGSNVLYILMHDILKMEHHSEKKNVPKMLFSLRKESIAAYLSGYFGGDGSFVKGKLEVSTTSKELANSLMTLLLYFGIVAVHKEKKEWSGSISHRVRFMWQDFLRIFQNEIGFCYKDKNKKLADYLSQLWIKRDKLKPRVEKDVYWDLVVEKKKEPYSKPYVYDIGINPTHRFIAGFGGVLVHNSEKHVRQIFKRARQVAPALIFFDEFDSISSMRGHSLSDATERVVNQLLTEMDGIEELEKVIVVAATNRPDLVDPGLLRPGRIDLKLEIGLPDENARVDILKVHMRDMPLEKGIDVKAISVQLSGASGADIEGVCREAGMQAIRSAIKQNAKKIKVTQPDFTRAIEEYKLREKGEDNPLVR